jgi:type IV secretory pathway VirB2 component (pilin)
MILHRSRHCAATRCVCIVVASSAPVVQVFAQSRPLQQGAESLVTEFTDIAAPFAILAVMVLGLFALAGRLTAVAALLALLGICVLFGAPQIVDWTRGLFGV